MHRYSCYTAAAALDINPSILKKTKRRFIKHVDPITYFAKTVLPNIREKESSKPKKKFKLAYFIMVHKFDGFQNLKQLVDALDDGTAIIMIHVDRKAVLLKMMINTWLSSYKNVYVSTKSYNCG